MKDIALINKEKIKLLQERVGICSLVFWMRTSGPEGLYNYWRSNGHVPISHLQWCPHPMCPRPGWSSACVPPMAVPASHVPMSPLQQCPRSTCLCPTQSGACSWWLTWKWSAAASWGWGALISKTEDEVLQDLLSSDISPSTVYEGWDCSLCTGALGSASAAEQPSLQPVSSPTGCWHMKPLGESCPVRGWWGGSARATGAVAEPCWPGPSVGGNSQHSKPWPWLTHGFILP